MSDAGTLKVDFASLQDAKNILGDLTSRLEGHGATAQGVVSEQHLAAGAYAWLKQAVQNGAMRAVSSIVDGTGKVTNAVGGYAGTIADTVQQTDSSLATTAGDTLTTGATSTWSSGEVAGTQLDGTAMSRIDDAISYGEGAVTGHVDPTTVQTLDQVAGATDDGMAAAYETATGGEAQLYDQATGTGVGGTIASTVDDTVEHFQGAGGYGEQFADLGQDVAASLSSLDAAGGGGMGGIGAGGVGGIVASTAGTVGLVGAAAALGGIVGGGISGGGIGGGTAGEQGKTLGEIVEEAVHTGGASLGADAARASAAGFDVPTGGPDAPVAGTTRRGPAAGMSALVGVGAAGGVGLVAAAALSDEEDDDEEDERKKRREA